MPPRIHVAMSLRHVLPRWHRRHNPTWPPVCTGFLSHPTAPSTPQRSASLLASLRDNRKAYKPEKRRGRGPSSGLGKTSGRGHKGQGQHGKVPAGFEGGQTPQRIVQGPHGFTNVFSKDITTLPISRIQSWIAQGRIDPSRPITPLQLLTSRCVHRPSDGIKLLTSSHRHDASIDPQPPLSDPLHIVVSKASAQAIAAVEAAGGTVMTRYYTKRTFESILRGRVHPAVSLRTHPTAARKLGAAVEVNGTPTAADAVAALSPTAMTHNSQDPISNFRIRTSFPNRLPDPTSRKDLEYYRDAARRGYLAHEVPEGDSPSLYFKTPKQKERERNEARAERRQRRAVAGPTGQAVQKRTVRPGEKVKIF